MAIIHPYPKVPFQLFLNKSNKKHTSRTVSYN